MAELVVRDLSQFIPAYELWYRLAPLLFLFTTACAWVTGYIRKRYRVRVPFTRKIFHFLIIPSAVVVQLVWGLEGTVVYGTITTLVVLYAVYRGKGCSFYDALARPSDEPRPSLFIVVPLAMTALGGMLSNLLFDSAAMVGYAVCGFGDAIAEPVGSQWGKHEYEVPSLGGVSAVRSYEGSLSVIVAGGIASVVVLGLMSHGALTVAVVGASCGLVGGLIEAISNHGLDNFTLQIVIAGWVYLLLDVLA